MRFFKKPKANDDDAPPPDDGAAEKPAVLLKDRLAGLVASVHGAVGAVVVDYESGLTLATAGHGSADPATAGAANLAVVRAELKVLAELGLNGQVDDIQITLGTRSHLIRPLRTAGHVYVDLALAMPGGNPGLARHRLRTFATELES